MIFVFQSNIPQYCLDLVAIQEGKFLASQMLPHPSQYLIIKIFLISEKVF